MKVYIINISDSPASISLEETKKGESFLQDNKYIYENKSTLARKESITLFNDILKSWEKEIILFSSWGTQSINNTYSLGNEIWYEKIIIWFSDTLHIQAKYHDSESILNIYWITLRNIFLLVGDNLKLFQSYINDKEYKISLHVEYEKEKQISWRIYGGHLMIFVTTLLMYNAYPKNGDILYLEFHGIPSNFIYYYLNILKNKWVFDLCSWVICDIGFDADIDRDTIIKYMWEIKGINIYIADSIPFIPLYQKMNIQKWLLTLIK